MRIGLISDIHGRLRTEVFDLLAGVDRILFAGDVERLELLDDLEAIAPLDAVWGNVDGPEIRSWTREEIELDLYGVRFAVTHGHRVAPRFERLLTRFPAADVIVHGHSHVPSLDRFGSRWIVNPGAALKARGGHPPSVAIASLPEAMAQPTPDGGARVWFTYLALPGGEEFTPRGRLPGGQDWQPGQ